VISTVVASLNARLDPAANTVAGSTDPGRSVLVTLYDYQEPCSTQCYSMLVNTDSSGNFLANFWHFIPSS
jgi:hypothetical protein